MIQTFSISWMFDFSKQTQQTPSLFGRLFVLFVSPCVSVSGGIFVECPRDLAAPGQEGWTMKQPPPWSRLSSEAPETNSEGTILSNSESSY